MKGKIFLVDWNAESATVQAAALRREGFKVDVECENGGRAYRTIRTSVPDVVVLDLRKRPSHGREVGSALRDLRATRAVPILCLEDDEDARELTRSKIEDVRFASDGSLATAVLDAARERARQAKPRSPVMVKGTVKEGTITARARIPSTSSRFSR